MAEGKQQDQHNDDTLISEELSNLTISSVDQKLPTTTETPAEEVGQNKHTTDNTIINNINNDTDIDNQPQSGDMKLIIRSQFWGRCIKGKTSRSEASLNRPYRTISAQAVLFNTDEYWGCCPHHGKRVLEVQDYHFEDAVPQYNWDLYLVGSWVGDYHAIHDFFLLPQNQTVIDIGTNMVYNGWSFVGTCNSNQIVSDLDGMLRTLLKENENYGYRYHHAHIEIMMDKAFDKETPRTRKMNNEKARQERQQPNKITTQGESSETTDDTTSSAERDGPPSVNNNPFVGRSSAAPPIPNVISNDSSSVFSQSVGSPPGMHYHAEPLWYGSGDSVSYYNPAPPTFRATPTGAPVNDPHHGMQWHPGSALPLPTNTAPHWQHMNGPPPPPPPPPSIHGHMPSPPMFHHHHHHHQQMPNVQQYNMMHAADPRTAGYPGYGNIPQQHHRHPGPYPPHATAESYRPSIPQEIFSTPVSSGTNSMGTTVSNLKSYHPAGPHNGTASSSNVTTTTVPKSSSSDTKNGETLATTVVTTIANDTMVSSTCWANENSNGLSTIHSESHDSNGNSP